MISKIGSLADLLHILPKLIRQFVDTGKFPGLAEAFVPVDRQ
jgi:hypothetical protein